MILIIRSRGFLVALATIANYRRTDDMFKLEKIVSEGMNEDPGGLSVAWTGRFQ